MTNVSLGLCHNPIELDKKPADPPQSVSKSIISCVTLGRSYYLSVLISQTIKKIEIVLSNLFFLTELLWKASEKMAIEHLVSYNKTLLKQ